MQRKGKLLFLVVGLGLLLSFVLSACGPAPVTTTTNVQKGGTLVDGLFEEPDSLIPNLSSETFAALVDATIWTPLVYGDPDGNLHPGLLSELPTVANGDISSDLKHYSLKLRSGLQWSDGQPLTAADVVFTIKLWNDPAYGAQFYTTGLPYIDYTSLKATNDTTVDFNLTQPFTPLIADQFADPLLAIMPQHVFGSMKPADIANSPENSKPSVSSGPFIISERVQADHITVVKNPKYYQASGGYPYLDKIIFKIIPDAGTVLTTLQSGGIDTSYFLDPTKVDSYNAIQNYKLVRTKSQATYENIIFNLTNPILKDLQVRKAISMSIDIDSIITQVLHGGAVRTCDEDVGTFAHNASATCYKFDPAGAKALLDADGWAMGSDGYRHKNGQTLELRWSTTANRAVRDANEAIGQSNLKDVGIKIDIVNYPSSTWFGTKLPGGDYDIGEFANSLGYDPDNGPTWLCDSPPASNWARYCNPTADQAMKTEETTPATDQNTRLQAFRTFQQQLLNDVPVVYLYAESDISISSNKVHNYNPESTGPAETWNVWQWWIQH